MSFKVEYSDRISSAGKYAFAAIDEKVAELKAKGVKVIDFGVGDPKSPTPDFVINALTECGRKRATYGYPSYVGDKSFREACAEYMKADFGVTLDPDTQICSTIGSKEAVFNFPLGFINPGDLVICPTPGYPVYATGTKFAGGEVYNVPLLEENNFLIDYENIPEDVAKKAKVIWTNYPNAPTGVSAPREWLEGLIEWAHKYNIIIAADEGCYIDIYFDKKPMSILEITDNGIITFYSLSKRNNMTGYRVGFVAGDADIIAGFKKVKTNIDSGTPTFIQDVASIAMKDNVHCKKMCDEYKEKMGLMLDALEGAGLPRAKTDSTFYIWQKAPDGKTGADLAERLIDLGIVVTPGAAISKECEGGVNPGRDYVRFALVATMEEVKDAVERLSKGELF